MATTYDSQLSQIERQRRIAEALRASGNEAIAPSIRTGGRFDAPVSKYEYANKALAQLLGAYQGVQADKRQRKLDAEDKAVLQDLLEKKRAADTPDDPLAEVVPLAPPPKTQADRQREFQVAAMRGQQFGGSAAPYAQESITRELFPKEEAPYTLNEGDVRYNKNNQPVAQGAPHAFKEPAEDRVLIDVIDPEAKSGRRTIARKDWKGEPLWHPPTAASGTGTMSPQQQAEVDTLAESVLNYRKAPLPLGTRNPLNSAVMSRVYELAKERGLQYNEFEYGAKSRAMSNFSGGPEGRNVRSFNTMLDHIGDLREAANQLQNGQLPALNKLGNWFSAKFGDDAPSRFNAIRNVIRAEVVKAVAGSPGAESDRQEALAAVDMAASPEQLQAALTAVEKLGAGQLGNLRRQFVASTGLDDARFNAFLSPKAAEMLGSFVSAEDAAKAPKTPVAPPAKPAGPPPGAVVDGFRFKGGDPNNQANWEPVK